MTSCRLNNLFLLYIHQDRTDSLDLYEIAKDFISVNNRRSILEIFKQWLRVLDSLSLKSGHFLDNYCMYTEC